MKYYLIDYENVNAAGLEGIDEISSDSRVVLFYTKNSSKIDLGVFNLLRTTSAELAVIEVHHGKQALDIQLASYVGFLIGTEPADTEYYIVSKDKGYRNIQDFWSDRRIVLCTSLREDSEIVDEPKPAKSSSRSSSRSSRSRSNGKAGKAEEKSEKAEPEKQHSEEHHSEEKHSRIKTKAEKNTKRERHEKVDLEGAAHPAHQDANPGAHSTEHQADKAPEPEPEAAEPKPEVDAFAEAAALAAAMAAAKSESGESNAVLTTKPKEEAKAEPEAKKKAPKKTSKKASKDAPKEETSEEPKKEKAPKKSSKKNSKDASKDAAKEEPKQKNSELRNEVNTEIQKILSKEGFSGDVINATASFVSKNIGKEGYKQVIYRGIIKDYGQKQGLAIYRLIKGVL